MAVVKAEELFKVRGLGAIVTGAQVVIDGGATLGPAD